MKDKISAGKEGYVVVSTEILKSMNISIEQLRHHLIELKLILGRTFDFVVPKNINDTATLQWLIGLSQRLQKLKQCDGFDRHIRMYTREQLQSNDFVTVIASYLLDKVDNVILEPLIIDKSKKPDILADLRGKQVYLECKHIETLRFDYSRAHEHMFSILRDYIDVPHQISITYKKTLSDTELHRLGEALQQRAKLVTGDGRIIHNPDIEIQVIRREAYGDKRLSATMSMITEDMNDNCRYVGHAYMRDGITLSLSGPKVDYTKILKEKIRKSKSQSPHDQPYMLMIDGNKMLGSLTENIRALSSAFQPKTNTRFSAAALVTHYLRLGSRGLDLRFYVVSNPFAKFPISKEFERLFQSSSTE
ncbi:MAG: hypothetical protein KAW83_04120 [Dehalococcoidia bacterium]|nr:hypothetical protein [Dehalococcoidia bacterium]